MSCNEWKEYKLEDICLNITDGKHGNCVDEDNSGYYFISAKDINEGKINYNNARQITKVDYEDVHKRTKLEIDDILITNSGTIGKMAIITEKDKINATTFQKSVAIVKPIKDLVLPRFLYYNLIYDIKYLINLAGGSVQKNLLLKDLRNLKVNIPSLEKQEKIANILSSLDDKIELNNEMNKTLEDIAKTLFKRWFVDFEFPNQDGEPYKSSGGEMVESESGMIPRGWKVKSLDEIANFMNGLAMQKFRPQKGETDSLPVLKIKELKQGMTSIDSDRCSCNIDSKYMIDNGEVIFAWSGSLDVRIWCGGKAGLNQHLFKVTSEKYPKWFYYLWTKRYLDDFIRIAADRATTMGHIKRSNLSQAKVLVPDNETLESMGVILRSLIDYFIENSIELKLFEELRDSLLPKLMSGQIKVEIV